MLVREKAERRRLFSLAFVVVEGRNEGQFLPAAAGRTKAVMVMKVVVVVGCFAASTAPFLQEFQQNIPGPPLGYSSIDTEVKLPLLGHPVIARMTAIVKMPAKKLDRTGMLTRELAEPNHGPGTMVRERGVPASFQ
jgi:hypothetical protein